MENRQLGFTTMELLTTVVLAGILMAMAVPSFNRMVAGNRLVDHTNDLVGALSFGRSEAIRRNRNMTLCRTATATSTTCATADANWENWILLNAEGDVVKRGTFNTYGNTHHVSSTLANESIVFGPDGLARTGGALVGGTVESDGSDSATHAFTVCTTRLSDENIRTLTLGSSSRVVNTRGTGTCS